jgi:hypothetical protein
MSDTIRIITYDDANIPDTNQNNQNGGTKSLDTVIPYPSKFAHKNSSKSSDQSKLQAVGEFEVEVDILEIEMSHLIDVVKRLLTRAEKQTRNEIALDEIELSVEVNGKGQISILGNGVQAGSKGAIKLKFKRQQRKDD